MTIDLSSLKSLYEITGNITDHNATIINFGVLREIVTTKDKLVTENQSLHSTLERVYYDLVTSSAYEGGDQTCAQLVQLLEPMVHANI